MSNDAAQLEILKSKLVIDLTDTDQDSILLHSLASASEYVLRFCGLTVLEETKTEIKEKVPVEGRFLTDFRPVKSVTSVEASSYGGSFTAVSYQLFDAQKGKVSLACSDLSFFTRNSIPAWRKYAYGYFDLLKIVYVTEASDLPTDLEDIITSLASYWHNKERQLCKSVKVGPITETAFDVSASSIPESIMARLNRHTRRKVAWVV